MIQFSDPVVARMEHSHPASDCNARADTVSLTSNAPACVCAVYSDIDTVPNGMYLDNRHPCSASMSVKRSSNKPSKLPAAPHAVAAVPKKLASSRDTGRREDDAR